MDTKDTKEEPERPLYRGIGAGRGIDFQSPVAVLAGPLSTARFVPYSQHT
jgi:hypothetical protein